MKGSQPPTLKRLGQHFLRDTTVLERIVDALSPTVADVAVEIGPGRGALTELLAPRVGKLIAVELDRALAAMLRERFERDSHVSIVESDILKTDVGELAGKGYILAGNVPYYITTPILFHVLEGELPSRAVFLVQREVADRATAPAGSRTYGALSVNLQVVARVERLFDVPPSAFQPPPKVQSAVLRMTPLAETLITSGERRAFRGFVQALFSGRRKQLGNSLRSVAPRMDVASIAAALESVGVTTAERPERLTPTQFVELFRAVRESER